MPRGNRWWPLKNNRSSCEQAYNAQAVVDVEAVPAELGSVVTVLADTGYANGVTAQKVQRQGLKFWSRWDVKPKMDTNATTSVLYPPSWSPRHLPRTG